MQVINVDTNSLKFAIIVFFIHLKTLRVNGSFILQSASYSC